MPSEKHSLWDDATPSTRNLRSLQSLSLPSGKAPFCLSRNSGRVKIFTHPFHTISQFPQETISHENVLTAFSISVFGPGKLLLY